MGDLFKQRQLALVAAELMFLVPQGIGVPGGPRVFEISPEGRVGQPGTAVELVILKLGEHAKPLGVAFEVEEVAALVIRHVIQPATPCSLLEPVANGIFA
ncbi:hypothetical protein D3C81_1606730 [compost metagenome]